MTEPKSADWLTKRSEFLRAAKGRRFHTALFTIQAVQAEKPGSSARFGLTVTSKEGHAVERNRIKRRLRQAIKLAARGQARPSTDYVIIGRRTLLNAPFRTILTDLHKGVARLEPSAPDFKTKFSNSGKSA